MAILAGFTEEAFARAGGPSIGMVLVVLAVVGAAAAAVRRGWPLAAACGALSLACAADYSLQMLRAAEFHAFILQTFGLGIVAAAIGGIVTIAGAAWLGYRRH